MLPIYRPVVIVPFAAHTSDATPKQLIVGRPAGLARVPPDAAEQELATRSSWSAFPKT